MRFLAFGFALLACGGGVEVVVDGGGGEVDAPPCATAEECGCEYIPAPASYCPPFNGPPLGAALCDPGIVPSACDFEVDAAGDTISCCPE